MLPTLFVTKMLGPEPEGVGVATGPGDEVGVADGPGDDVGLADGPGDGVGIADGRGVAEGAADGDPEGDADVVVDGLIGATGSVVTAPQPARVASAPAATIALAFSNNRIAELLNSAGERAKTDAVYTALEYN
jgi:hypothetical protein